MVESISDFIFLIRVPEEQSKGSPFHSEPFRLLSSDFRSIQKSYEIASDSARRLIAGSGSDLNSRRYFAA